MGLKASTPTILAWLSRCDGKTPDGRPRWWVWTAWPGDRHHVSVTDLPPPEERLPDWRWSEDEQGYRVAQREDNNGDR